MNPAMPYSLRHGHSQYLLGKCPLMRASQPFAGLIAKNTAEMTETIRRCFCVSAKIILL